MGRNSTHRATSFPGTADTPRKTAHFTRFSPLLRLPAPASLPTMEEREEQVFKAKLAEQAERYNGKPRLAFRSVAATLERWPQRSIPLPASQPSELAS